MEQRLFRNGESIFRQGDESTCMYRIESGKVGIFLNYGKPNQTKLTELPAGQFLGEMGLLDGAPRSAAAVSMSDDTALSVIKAESLSRYLNEEPDVMRALLQQMSTRLRRISRDCTDACRTVNAVVEAEKAGKTEDPALKNRIAKTLAGFEASRLEGREEGGNDA